MINVGIATIDLYPMEKWSPSYQLAFFIFIEHIVLLAAVGIDYIFKSKPQDVRQIDYFNLHFTRQCTVREKSGGRRDKTDIITIPREEKRENDKHYEEIKLV